MLTCGRSRNRNAPGEDVSCNSSHGNERIDASCAWMVRTRCSAGELVSEVEKRLKK